MKKKHIEQKPACIKNDSKFAKELEKNINRIKDNQLKAGKLIYYYVAEHGTKYGTKGNTYLHIAALVHASVRSLRNWHKLYRLHAEYGATCANLPKLDISAQYHVARLLPDVDRKRSSKSLDLSTQIPVVINQAVMGKLSVNDVEMLVNETERMAGKTAKKTKPEAKDTGDQKNIFSLADLDVLKQATEILLKLSRTGTTLGGVADATVEDQLSRNGDALLRAYEERVNKGLDANIEVSIATIHSRAAQMLSNINKSNRKTA